MHIFEGFFCNFFHVHTERLFIVWYRKRVTTESLSSHPMHFSANVFSSRKLPVYTIFKEAKRVTSRKATFVVMPRSSFGKCCVLCCVKKACASEETSGSSSIFCSQSLWSTTTYSVFHQINVPVRLPYFAKKNP